MVVTAKNRMAKKRTAAAAKPKASNGKQAEAERIAIPRPDLRTFTVTLVGSSSLIVHRFSEKAKKQIEDKQGQKAKQARGKRDPKAEYLAACYVFPDCTAGERGCVYGVKASMVKASMVEACRFINGVPMTIARGAFQVLADPDGGALIRLKHKKMRMDTDYVTLSGPSKARDIRYRPEFLDWSLKLTIKYNASVISAEQIINLLAVAGFSCGLGEKRPSSSSGPGYSHGMYEVKA